jgi:hypothetical protein
MIIIYVTKMLDLRLCAVNAQYNVTKYVDFFYKSVYFEGNAFYFVISL